MLLSCVNLCSNAMEGHDHQPSPTLSVFPIPTHYPCASPRPSAPGPRLMAHLEEIDLHLIRSSPSHLLPLHLRCTLPLVPTASGHPPQNGRKLPTENWHLQDPPPPPVCNVSSSSAPGHGRNGPRGPSILAVRSTSAWRPGPEPAFALQWHVSSSGVAPKTTQRPGGSIARVFCAHAP